MFASPLFTASALGAAMALFTVIGTGFLLVIFLGRNLGFTPWQISLHMVFMPGTAFVSAFAVTAPLIATGGFGTFALSQLDSGFSLIDVAWRLALVGTGVALMIAPAAAVAVHACSPSLAPRAGAVNTAFRQIGGALAPAVLGSLYTRGSVGFDSFTSTIQLATWLLVATGIVVSVAAVADRKQ